MFSIIGIVVVLGAILAGFLMEKGPLLVLMQPSEFIIIAGAGLGTLVAGNQMHVLKNIISGLIGVIGGSKFSKQRYLDSLRMMFHLFNKARKEGMVGMSLMMGLRRGIFRSIMQITGGGLRIKAKAFQDVLHNAPRLQAELCHFALMHGMQVAQLAACNRLHEVDQRLVRWLLMCQDRVDFQSLPLTHDFLAQMLGTGRPSVSLAAADLENAGLIENQRGTVKVLNRKSLEDAACECYGVIQHFNGGLGLK